MTSTKRVRMWRWRASPLRRRSDKAEAWVILLAFVLVVLGGAAAAVLTWTTAWNTAEEQRAERQRVSAVVLKNADTSERETFYKAPNADTTRVPVRWTAPDGTSRQGTAEVPDGSKAGITVPVWVAPDGSQTGPPAGTVTAAFQSGLCAALAAGAVAAVVCASQSGVRSRIDRRRAEEWERAWAEVEPRWRPRTP